MDHFTLFHLYLIFFFLGLGYATIAVLLGQLVGGHEGDAAGHEAGHGAAGHDTIDHGAGHGTADHGHAAGDVSTSEPMPVLSPWSPVTIATFITAFGGTGIILHKMGQPAYISIPAAGVSGFVIAICVFYMFYYVFKITQSTSSVSVRHAVGQPAEVLASIPADGLGEIAYVLGGRRFNASARSSDGKTIPAGKPVVICHVSGGCHYVKERNV